LPSHVALGTDAPGAVASTVMRRSLAPAVLADLGSERTSAAAVADSLMRRRICWSASSSVLAWISG